MNRLRTLFPVLGLILVVMACNEDDETVQSPINPNPQPLQLVIGASIDDSALTYNTTYANIAGTTLQFTRVAFYMSEFSFQRGDDESVSSDSATVLLKDGDFSESYILAEVPNEGFNELSFFVGLPNAINHADPTLASAPLDDPSLHWNWNPSLGYLFARIEGRYDSNTDGVITNADDQFQYHAATNNLYTRVSLNIASAPTESEIYGPVLISLDMRMLFNGINIPQSSISHGATDENIQMMNNFESAMQAGQ